MAFDQTTRNHLQRFVTDARRALEAEFTRQLQKDYGLDPASGTTSRLERLHHINDQQRETARILRDTLAHYCAGSDLDTKSGLERIVREQAFNILNRLAALRMAEARGLLIESVGNGYQAKGFQLYSRLAGAGLGETGDAYRVYLQSVFDEFSLDLPGLFDRFSPQGRLFPSEASLLQVLALINHSEIEPLWAEDETIGWIYQYFNSKEERKAMREASQAPRNSRELAVRNQFFTPRYVVEFLVDNTLGQLWFNWTGGKTGLRDRCRYLLVKQHEQSKAANRLRDPRTIKLLDPACGSMHFGLYAFDLFQEIYREAWDWEHAHGPGALDRETGGSPDLKPLSKTYADQDAFLRDVPRLIIEHNIYGVDIDPRAAQIASLALWLRAQRAWHEVGVKAKDRPQVGQGHVVAAVAPPAEVDLRKRFMEELDPLDAELFEQTLFMLKGLPELGVLLQVEKELPALIRKVFRQHGDLFRGEDMAHWQKAETRLREALTEYARAARSTYQGRLFAEDALQGLRMIDHCREVYDVVVMNPPFGEISQNVVTQVTGYYPTHTNNLICAFIERMYQMLRDGGLCASVIDRTVLIKNSYEDFRKKNLLDNSALQIVADLGWGVLDANVEVSTLVLGKRNSIGTIALGLNVSDHKEKALELLTQTQDPIALSHDALLDQPFSSINFQMPRYLRQALKNGTPIIEFGAAFYNGHTIKSDVFKRLFWEVHPRKIPFEAKRMWNGSEYSPFYVPLQEIVISEGYAGGLLEHKSTILRSPSKHQLPGLCFGKRGEYLDVQILPEGFVLTNEGFGGPSEAGTRTWFLLGLLNSLPLQAGINFYCGQHKGVGYVNVFPIPEVTQDQIDAVAEISEQCYQIIRQQCSFLEIDPNFETPIIYKSLSDWSAEYRIAGEALSRQVAALDKLVCDIYSVDLEEREAMLQSSSSRPQATPIPSVDPSDLSATARFWAKSSVSYLLGSAFGRWKLCENTMRPREILYSRKAWCAPPPQQVPLNLNESEIKPILVEDPGSKLDVVACVQESLWKLVSEKSDDVIADILRCLEAKDLRQYVTNPGMMFSDHLIFYTKSRRKAPIFWPLSTSSGSYTLWLYYPSLTSQTLYTAVNDFVEPKLKQVGRDTATLRDKGAARSREDEKAFEALQALELELIELRDTLLQIAPTYRPDHDDGVQITAAPLWQLFRHKPWQKILKDTWSKLEKGEYDWAHLALAYWPDRVREKCNTDKSLAIAHNLEALYVEPKAHPKKVRASKKSGDDK